jgi:hypothetical protein
MGSTACVGGVSLTASVCAVAVSITRRAWEAFTHRICANRKRAGDFLVLAVPDDGTMDWRAALRALGSYFLKTKEQLQTLPAMQPKSKQVRETLCLENQRTAADTPCNEAKVEARERNPVCFPNVVHLTQILVVFVFFLFVSFLSFFSIVVVCCLVVLLLLVLLGRRKKLVLLKVRKQTKQDFDYLLVLDFEATCQDGAEKITPQEIIEVPVILLNMTTLKVASACFVGLPCLCLSVCLSAYDFLSVCPSVCVFVCLSVDLSLCLATN